MTEKLSRNSA